jgi:AmmeMemoRadiSam system protein B
VRITGEVQVGELEQHLYDALNEAGFLENDRYRELKGQREAEFAQEPTRFAAFAGSAYPEEGVSLSNLLHAQIGRNGGNGRTIAIAAPHASPDASWETYKAAYAALPSREEAQDATFVILGTSHYGAPDRFGLTRKTFQTPFGETRNAVGFVDELESAAPDAIGMEDYCHAVEHSIEFQVIILQHLYGASVRVLPILCGPFVKSLYEGGMPEDDDSVARFFDVLGNLFAREGNRVYTVLGIDMAHIGRRYGDPIRATARVGEMLAIEQRDRQRISQIERGDIAGYWSLVQEGHDDLKWCGSAPLYTFLKTQPRARAELLRYHQWQIDPESVVSFGALQFTLH